MNPLPRAFGGAFLVASLLFATGSRTALAAENPGATAPRPTGSVGSVVGRVINVVTGQNLHQARVSVQGTNHVAYTDKFGIFQLIAVPAGPVVLEVFYTGLDSVQVPLVAVAGATIEQAVSLTSVARYGSRPETVSLDPFIVASDRETDAQAIAANEQRFAPNLKNVMSTDALGDVLGSSVGEYLKFIPGLTAEYDFAEVAGISVRGIGGAMTTVSTDGAPASGILVTATRATDLRSMSLNDISRIELTKVPTPANPADSLGGAVNMVSKSALERGGREFRYGLNFTGNHEHLTLRRTPHAFRDRLTHKVLPGANFDFTWPVTKTFGLVLSGMSSSVYSTYNFVRTTWATAGTGTNAQLASIGNPYLQQFLLYDGPRDFTRNTLSAKADWKLARHGVLSLGHTINRMATHISAPQITFNAGSVGTPTVATGAAMTWDPASTRGAAGRGSITNSGNHQTVDQLSDVTNLTFRHDDGRWRVESGLSRSASETRLRFEDAGHFFQTLAANNRPVRINFLQIDADKPGAIEVFDDNNRPVDWRDLANYRGTTATTRPWHIRKQFKTAHLNVRRRLDLLPFPTAMQIGGMWNDQVLDTRPTTITWNFDGPDGVSGATAPMSPYAMQVYRNVDSHYGFRDIQWISATRAWDAFQRNPRLYGKTAAQLFTEESTRIVNSERLQETVEATYAQIEADLLRNRLRLLTGVRHERTMDRGEGAFTDADAVWQRDAAGNYLRTPAGARIRRPEAGAVNSLEQLRLTLRERASFSRRTYDGWYPSFHLAYNASENVLVRAAYASTYGRPDFSNIIPRTVATAADLDASDPDPATGRGTLNTRNAALKPWTADNYDLSLEYYGAQGGLVSAGVFVKQIRNFFANGAKIATAADLAELGLDPRYAGWNLVTMFNGGDARIRGAEVNLRQSLRALGAWGAHFIVFANATKLELDGAPGGSFTSFIPESGNWGASFNRKRISLTARWNYRGLDRRTPQAAFGADGFEYIQARTMLDLNASYQMTRRLAVTANVRNVTNEPLTLLRYGSATPAHARQYQEAEFGVQLAVGLRGTF